MGTRGSDLALWQARRVVELLERSRPDTQFQIVEVTTRGDRDRETPLHLTGGIGLFVKALEIALLDNEIDLAVHSLKDMPSRTSHAFALGAIPQRGDPRDALISKRDRSLADLPAGARVGTGSPRRKAQILALRPDLQILGVRGNVDTRLRKLEGPDYDALVLAAAGLARLGRKSAITEVLPPEMLLPAAGQGAIAVEIRGDDEKTRALAAPVNHLPSWVAAKAERSFMATLGVGCHVPAAAYAVVEGSQLWLRGLVSSQDGQAMIRSERRGSADDAKAVGKAVAEELMKHGAEDLLHAA